MKPAAALSAFFAPLFPGHETAPESSTRSGCSGKAILSVSSRPGPRPVAAGELVGAADELALALDRPRLVHLQAEPAREQREHVLGREVGVDVRGQRVEQRDDRVEERLERADEADAEVVLLVDRRQAAAQVRRARRRPRASRR